MRSTLGCYRRPAANPHSALPHAATAGPTGNPRTKPSSAPAKVSRPAGWSPRGVMGVLLNVGMAGQPSHAQPTPTWQVLLRAMQVLPQALPVEQTLQHERTGAKNVGTTIARAGVGGAGVLVGGGAGGMTAATETAGALLSSMP